MKERENWNSHLKLLEQALKATSGDVVEMGMGDGSTKYLHDYCRKAGRNLYSYDNNLEWVEKFTRYRSKTHRINYVDNWDLISERHGNASVVLIDHAAGERRKEDIQRLKDINGILVIHDTEPSSDHGYQMRQYFSLFKYIVEDSDFPAWTTAVSNTISL